MTLPQSPYYAVIFTSVRTSDDPDGYERMAMKMASLAATMPGYLGLETARGEDGLGITISYWRSEEEIRCWREHAEHLEAQALGRSRWYKQFTLRICRVEREREFTADGRD